MAVNVFCNNPQMLLREIKAAIKEGHVDTWSVDDDGDFTHSPDQWKFKAWMRPKALDDRLVFNILCRRGETLSRVVYGVYHGRFIEMRLNHFDEKFTRASESALPAPGDVITANA